MAIYFVFFKKNPATNIPNTDGIGTNGDTTTFPDSNTGQNVTNNTSNNTNGNTDNTGNNIGNVVNNNLDNRFNTTQSKNLINKITNLESSNISAGSGNLAQFYNQQDGKFYKISPDGTIVPLTDQVFFNVSNVTWAQNNNESIIEYPDGANIYYNFTTKEQVTLPTHWEDFSFSVDGSQIAAKSIGLDPNNRWLVTSDPKGQNVTLIEPMGNNADKVIVDWSPNRQVVALSATGDPLGSERQQILPVGLNQENYKGLIVEGQGLQIEWSEDGSKLLHSVYNGSSDYKPELWVVDATPDTMGENRKPLGVNTWASKCAMADNRFVYCGVPTTMESGAGFTPEISNYVADEIYKIDVQTGIKTIIPSDGFHTIETMTLSEDGSTLYFTDVNDTGIFELEIK